MTDSCSCLFKKQKEISLFRHTIIRHAHLKPDIILSLIHLAQEGEVLLPLARSRARFLQCPSYLILGNEGPEIDDDRRLAFANIRVVYGRHIFTLGGHHHQ